MNTQNLTIFDISTSIGLVVPKNILDYLVMSYGKKQTIDILSETVGYKIDKFNTNIQNFVNLPDTNLPDTNLPNTNSLDFKEPNEFNYDKNKHKCTNNELKTNRFRSESNTSNMTNIGEDCADEIQIVRDNFIKKYLEKLNHIHNNIPISTNYHEYEDNEINQNENPNEINQNENPNKNIKKIYSKSDEEIELYEAYLEQKKNMSEYFKKRNFVDNLSDEWVKKYLKEDKNQSVIQGIIRQAYKDGILDMLDPSLVDSGKLQKAWDVIHKYELWIENINSNYWEKLTNLIDHDYKYIKL